MAITPPKTRLAGLLLLLGLALLVGLGVGLEAASRPDLASLAPLPGPLVTDRDGRMLRLFPDAQGRRVILLPPGPLPETVVQAFVAAEDQRFRHHPGVDPLAALRAMLSNLKAGRIVSGASTLTQQLARLTHPGPRTWGRKITEMFRSLRIELALSKEDILRHYLNRVPQGNNLMGVETAAFAYFSKPAARLTAPEAALLASLAKAPSRLNPLGPNQTRLLARRNWVLQRMASLGSLPTGELALAQADPSRVSGQFRRSRGFPFHAPHLVELALKAGAVSPDGIVRTTVDAGLQRQAEVLVASHRARLAKNGASQAAAIIVDNRTLGVAALVGSCGYGPRDQGYNNGATAWRSPGSALKPFLYALALDLGFTPADVLEDVERRYRTPRGQFFPANFDRFAHGPVSFREALGNSLNLSAVRLLDMVGAETFYDTLAGLGLINRPQHDAGHYGLGLVVGNPEVSLWQLAAAYASLANGGVYPPPRLRADEPEGLGRQLFSPQAAYVVSDILSDPLARARIFGGAQAMNPASRLAIKTGTSTRYRDCWAVGYTPEYTLAVWVGNFDGRPTARGSGAALAAPILADLAAALFNGWEPAAFPRPQGVAEAQVCAFSGAAPGPACAYQRRELFILGAEPAGVCTYHNPRTPYHHMPTPFAGWLHQRFTHGGAGRFRLAGFNADLEKTFQAVTSSPPAPVPAAATPRPAGASLLTIIYPLPGDQFILEQQRDALELTVKAVAAAPLPQVAWFLNSREMAAAGPPYELTLQLPRGRHRLTVLGPDGRGDTVEVKVQ